MTTSARLMRRPDSRILDRHPKVITHLMGGLGNQMFQYAAGRALALRTGRMLELDASEFVSYPLRPFLLDRFTLEAPQISEKTLALLRMRPKDLGKAVRWLRGWQTIRERQHTFKAFSVRRNASVVYLKGFWQSESYFSDCAETIRHDFSLRQAAGEQSRSLLDLIHANPSVAVHIRRGDYVTNPAAAAFHGLCGLDYYHKALELIAEKVRAPHLFVFSDDIPWARGHLRTPHPMTFVDHNSAADPCEDLRLMAACRHFVIANSSFSWWGAWLSRNAGKIVIAPKQWFQSTEKDTKDQVPDSWIRI